MMPFNLCKFSVFCFIASVLLISNADATFPAQKSGESDLKHYKIIPKNESKNEFYTNETDTNKGSKIQITETSLNSNEYMGPFVNIRKQNESFAQNGLLWDNENSQKKVEGLNEMQMIYWYYNKVMAVILGICFGIILNLENAKVIFREPIGPSIGIFCKFILSPFVSLAYHSYPYLSFLHFF